MAKKITKAPAKLTAEFIPAKLTKGQHTRRQILEAAGRCISKIGIEKTSITNIAIEANVKRPLIAYHFPKKDEIFYEVMMHILSEMGSSFEGAAIPFARDGLKIILGTYLKTFHERPYYVHCFLHCYYLASFQERYNLLNTQIAEKGYWRLGFKINEMILETGYQGGHAEKHTRDFSEKLYALLIGYVLNYYSTSKHRKSFDEAYTEWMLVIDREVEAFLVRMKAKN